MIETPSRSPCAPNTISKKTKALMLGFAFLAASSAMPYLLITQKEAHQAEALIALRQTPQGKTLASRIDPALMQLYGVMPHYQLEGGLFGQSVDITVEACPPAAAATDAAAAATDAAAAAIDAAAAATNAAAAEPRRMASEAPAGALEGKSPNPSSASSCKRYRFRVQPPQIEALDDETQELLRNLALL